MEGKQAAPVVREEGDADGIDLVEIEMEHKYPVTEAVLLRRKAVVHHVALVEAGVHDQIGSPVTARAQSSAEVKASSWKPYLK